jgi:hypothetical protein
MQLSQVRRPVCSFERPNTRAFTAPGGSGRIGGPPISGVVVANLGKAPDAAKNGIKGLTSGRTTGYPYTR